MTTLQSPPTARPGVALGLIAAATLLSMSAWFSATVVVPQLRGEWGLGSGGTALLTIGVQVGFVLGAVASAATGLADRIPGRRLITVGALGAAASNALFLLADGLALAVPLRVATGIFLAGVYPPAIKEVSSWFRRGRGLALGVMIGALTLGSALPHLVNALGALDWQAVIAATSVLTALGGLLVLLVRSSGPYAYPQGRVNARAAIASLRRREVVLADLGYVGHMWELYAMWAGIGPFLLALPAIASSDDPGSTASGLAFLCIGVGALGCLAGGVVSDRRGRADAALLALVLSGATALVLAATYAVLPVAVVVALCCFWGFWVIADSAQFSALVTEHSAPETVGSALSLQLALGYLTTTVTLYLVPALVEATSWHVALAVLAIGPGLGALAMQVSRRESAASTSTH